MKVDIIYNEDCLEGMRKRLSDKSIDLTVTSPPYDNLRTYGGYVFNFEPIARELYRVTKDGGVVVWVIGDETINGSETGTSFKQALYFKEIGFNLHDTMIYDKGGVGGCKGSNYAYWNGFEYMFIFTKNKPKSFNPINDKLNKSAGRKMSGTDRQKNGTTRSLWAKGKIVNKYSKRTNVWLINEGYRQKNHPATFPERLAQDHILSWSNRQDVILDPLCGSGTTLKMAKKNHRHYIGFEINSEYYEIAKKRVENLQLELC